MRRRFIFLPVLALVVAGFSATGAGAHACEDPDDPSTCEETPVQPNWRDGNYIPLFDLEDRDDEGQRYDAQRWRDECNTDDPQSPGYQSRQMCFWAYGGFSLIPNRGSGTDDPNNFTPNEWHLGFAATHCFLMEAAHQCEDHEAGRGEGVHDAHGGALYADVCLTENPESKYCDDGMQDTQVGVTIMDHNACGTIVPIVACTDEYHVIRPFDQGYTEEQMNDSAEYTQRIADDPILYLCGKPEYRGGNPICPGEDEEPEGLAPGGAPRALAFSGPAAAARAELAELVQLSRALRSLGVIDPMAALGAAPARASSPAGAADAVLFVMVGLAIAWRAARRAIVRA